MTHTRDILAHLSGLGIGVRVDGADMVLSAANIPAELLAALRHGKPALVVELLRRQADELRVYLDGDAPYAERLARLPEYQEILDQLPAAQARLFESFRAAGFLVVWGRLVEEFLLVGDGEPPPGSEDMAVYSWQEVRALKDASPKRVVQAHWVKRAFGGKVMPCGE